MFDELPVEVIAISSIVYSSVTVRTQRNYVVGIVCPSVTTPVEMMNFQERLSARANEGCLVTAPLTNTISDAQRVPFDDF